MHICQAVMKCVESEESSKSIHDLKSRTDPLLFLRRWEIDTAAMYQLPGLELVEHSQRKIVAG